MTAIAAKPVTPPANALPQIRVMVVDDSAAIRGFLTRWIESDKQLKVVASAHNGKVAVEQIKTVNPDIVILDIEMPEMDGIQALPLLLKACPDCRIIMASTLTRRNAEISLKALSAGATDYVPKPTSVGADDAGEAFRRELVTKIISIARSRPVRKAAASGVKLSSAQLISGPIKLRPASSAMPQILAIGSSTGGPQALGEVMKVIAPGLKVPVVITQHMPPTFTAILAESIARTTGLTCAEARNGEMLKPGQVYIAPGDYHMLIKGRNGPIELNQAPHENFCRPAVDPMLRSLSAVYGPAMLSVILTGMGSDGCEGAKIVAAAGGTVLAQDEATSIVWGMPAAVAHAGLASAVLPLNAVGAEIRKHLGMGK
jgi:two-component system, chemotaxis family, protein-glutamate methylesterase/glutaminase